jgi:peptidoglycan/xylan/chitin deacetylase (PgdA/CDA1 family)
MRSLLVGFALSSLLASIHAAPLEEASELLKRAGLAQVISSCTKAKTVALTFDDGPWIYEGQVATLLLNNGIKGTFCLNGNNYECIYDPAEQARVKAIYAAGHQIVSHTWSHPHLTTLDTAGQTKEFQLNDLAFQRILGVTPAFLRPPYGEYNTITQQVAYNEGKKLLLWDFDSRDSDGATVSQSEGYYDALIAQKPNNILTLNHETEQGTVQTLIPYVIKKLKAAGYSMVTVSECLGGMPAYTSVTSPQSGSWSCSDTTIPPPPPPPPTGSNQIHPNGDTTWCVDVQSDSNGAAVVLEKCSTLATKWSLSSGNTAVTTDNGAYSFDAGSGTPANGTPLKIWQSYSGIPAQSWYLTADNRIAVANSGQCLDLPSGNKAAGQRLQVWACGTGNNNQVWTLS